MEWIDRALGILALALGTWISNRIVKPKDHERAELLARIADAAAALTLSLYPKATWAELLDKVVQNILAAAGVPTRDRGAVERAAAAALANRGKLPNG